MSDGWIGVDLDGTLAKYNGWQGEKHIGAPVPVMVERVKKMLQDGHTVKIMTARASEYGHSPQQIIENTIRIQDWCLEHVGARLEVTSDKDFEMIALYDDRAIQVKVNSGTIIGDSAELQDGLEYATKIAIAMKKQYPQNTEWRPLPDLIGVLTQIDNMAAGMERKNIK